MGPVLPSDDGRVKPALIAKTHAALLTFSVNSTVMHFVLLQLPRSPRGVSGRLASATFFMSLVVLSGTTSYYVVGDGRWSVFDCLYMTVITLSTVGFGEVLPGMHDMVEARAVTLGLIILGSGTLLYFISNLTAWIIEGDLGGILRRRRMHSLIAKLENHVIVCGAGTTGVHIVRELDAIGTPFVVIELKEERLHDLEEELDRELLHVIGDATDDHVLERAGIEKARGVIASLSHDKDNLFVTITARALNPDARIVAKSVEESTEAKLRRAGADTVVSPNLIGGMRLVSEMVRPQAIAFLDRMLRDRDGRRIRIEEIAIPEGSSLIGKTLAETTIRDTGALVIAVHQPNEDYIYNPGPDLEMQVGAALIVLAEAEAVERLRRQLAAARRR